MHQILCTIRTDRAVDQGHVTYQVTYQCDACGFRADTIAGIPDWLIQRWHSELIEGRTRGADRG